MTIYRRPVPNKVTSTSLLHFDHKTTEIVEEPDEYQSEQERGSVSNTNGKGSIRGAAKYRTKFNTKRGGLYLVKLVQSDQY